MNPNDERTPADTHSSGDPGGEYSNENEIDLAGLIAVLYRQRRMIVVVTLLFALTATGMVAGRRSILPEKSTASMLIEVGQRYVGDSDKGLDYEKVESFPSSGDHIRSLVYVDNSDKGLDYQKVESLPSSEARIRALAKVIYKDRQINSAKVDKSKKPEFSLEDDFTIDFNNAGSAIELELEAWPDSNALSFLNAVADAFINKHKRIFERCTVQLENTIQRIKLNNQEIDLKIKNLENKILKVRRTYETRKIAKQNDVQDLNTSVESQLLKKSLIQKKLALLENEKEKLKQRIEQANENDDLTMNSKLRSNASSKGPDTVSPLLFASQIHQIRSYADKLESRLWYTIPENQNELKTKLQHIDLQIQRLNGSITLEKKELEQLKLEQEGEIKEIRQTIRKKEIEKENNQLKLNKNQNILTNIQNTRVLLPADFSEKPLNRGDIKMASILGIFAGLFMGVFLAFLAEFWKNNKEKITPSH